MSYLAPGVALAINQALMGADSSMITIPNGNTPPEQVDWIKQIINTMPEQRNMVFRNLFFEHQYSGAISSEVFSADMAPAGNDKPELQPETKRRGTFFTALESLEPQPPIDWIIEGFFSAGSLSILVGDPKSKKTYVMIDAAVSVAQGEPWLTHPTVKKPVLIIDEESGQRRLKRRLGDVQRGHFVKGSIPIFCSSLAGYDFGKIDDINELQNAIIQTQAGLIIIDALADIMPGRDENSVKDVQPVLMALRRVAEFTQAAIVIIHHTNKGGQQRGSTAILGAVDLMLTITSAPKSNLLELKAERARDVEPFEIGAEIRFNADQTYLVPRQAQEPTIKLTRPQIFILHYLKEHKQSSMEDITQAAVDEDYCARSTAKTAANDLRDDGFIERVDNAGRGTKGTYALTSNGLQIAEGLQ